MKRLLALATLLAAPLAQAAGTAQVTFAQPQQFSDIGQPRSEANAQLRALAAHVQRLAAGLPDGQRIEVEFTDVDLAGEVRWLSRFTSEVRVVRNTVDWARLSLRWRLLAGERELASGTEQLADPLALHDSTLAREPLGREQRLLNRWWAERVLQRSR